MNKIWPVAIAAMLLVPACSASDDEAFIPSKEDRAATSSAAGEPAEVEIFDSGDGFYNPPDPLPKGKPGDLIRSYDMGEDGGSQNILIMYHSTDAAGTDRPVTGVVTYPTSSAPEGGWPIISTAPGTTGVGSQCGLSMISREASSWGIEGVAVRTDYIGLGVTGLPLHAYLSRPSEGHAVIDSVRAVKQLAEANAGDQWLSVGHSQGGHGALSTGELAAEYAPELDLLGTIALAPAAMLENVYGGIDPIVTSVLTAMVLYGGAGEHPEINISDYVTPEMQKASEVFETGCLDAITTELVPLVTSETIFEADPRQTEPAKSILGENEVGLTKTGGPLFVVQGTADDRVVLERTEDLFDQLCSIGQPTELLIVDGATHSGVIGQSAGQTKQWLQDRLDGKPAENDCP